LQGTKAQPNIVNAMDNYRMVGCVCNEEDTHIKWMWLCEVQFLHRSVSPVFFHRSRTYLYHIMELIFKFFIRDKRKVFIPNPDPSINKQTKLRKTLISTFWPFLMAAYL
jgi:hypothetical protein